ncbi:MAG: DUF1638 domain-containing protein, partial [Deltaproteobacteria bacterium]|nr:DUF1638 domain-containing protein [Deltaproteobacteria bacterium]
RRASRPATYFLTAGWMRHENNVVTSYRQTVERFGEKKADRVNRLMLKNYSRFGLVATGCYDLESAAEKIAPLAQKMGLSVETLPGDDCWLARLMTGPHHGDPDGFLVLPPRSRLDFDNWCSLLMGGKRAGPQPVSGQLTGPCFSD